MDKSKLPRELPPKDQAQGFTTPRIRYMNFGFGKMGGEAVWLRIVAPGGVELPVVYRNDTRRVAWRFSTGFLLTLDDGSEKEFATWDELRAYWPEFIGS